MPLKKENFIEKFENLIKQIDVDASDGREVPINMNWTDTGFLTKDTGFTLYGASTDELSHSLFYYKKKNGDVYIIKAEGTSLQTYNTFDRSWTNIPGCPTFTAGAEFGYIVYDDNLYFGNAVESFYKFDGTTFTEYASLPKGNIFEVFEDRLFVAGVTAEPLTTYYSGIATPTTFSGSDLVKPLGTDSITHLENYYGQLLIFKQESIWKLTFVYDSVVSLYVPKLEIQSNNYGACSRKSVTWLENDVWFFTGREVRAIGYKDQQIGVLGVNSSVLSENIKETLKLIDVANYDQCVCAYNNRRFYLAVPITDDTNDTTFVCHTLYSNSWTKYTDRDKARINSFLFIDGDVYSATSSPPYGVIDWQVDTVDTENLNLSLITE